MWAGFTGPLFRVSAALRARGGGRAPPADQRAQEEREGPGQVERPDADLERRRIAVVAEERLQELARVRILAHEAVRVPDVLDRLRKDPRLLELVRGVCEQAGGEDDEQDAGGGEALA